MHFSFHTLGLLGIDRHVCCFAVEISAVGDFQAEVPAKRAGICQHDDNQIYDLIKGEWTENDGPEWEI